jgi:hypothetical protein
MFDQGQYRLVYAANAQELETKVNEYLRNSTGMPIGNCVVVGAGSNMLWYQPMLVRRVM